MLDLLTGEIGAWLIGALALVAAWFGNNVFQRRKGRKQERNKQKEADHEEAADRRKRVDAVERVRDDLKFRD